jgi:hypothetical protein
MTGGRLPDRQRLLLICWRTTEGMVWSPPPPSMVGRVVLHQRTGWGEAVSRRPYLFSPLNRGTGLDESVTRREFHWRVVTSKSFWFRPSHCLIHSLISAVLCVCLLLLFVLEAEKKFPYQKTSQRAKLDVPLRISFVHDLTLMKALTFFWSSAFHILY